MVFSETLETLETDVYVFSLFINMFIFSSPCNETGVRDHVLGKTNIGFGVRVENLGDARCDVLSTFEVLCDECW